MGLQRRVGCLLAVSICVMAAFPAAAHGQDAGDDGAPAPKPQVLTPTIDPSGALTQVLILVGESLNAVTDAPDTPFVGEPGMQTFANGTSVQATSRMTDGKLHSEFVIQGGGARTVATVDADVCPNATGRVSARVKASDSPPNSTDPIEIEAVATGQVNDDAQLVPLAPKDVKINKGTGKDKALLERIARGVLKASEKAWRSGVCVTVEVQEGDSSAVAPKSKVHISAIGKPRFGGGEIKGRMEAHRSAGKKSVEPAQVSDSPAKFTYTAPDKRPESGEVTLASISRRGVGFAVLEYTTEADLKINAYGVTAVKCGGPAGPWKLHFEPYGSGTGDANASFTLAEDSFTGTYAFSGYADIGGGFSESGSVQYVPSPNQSGTGTLVMNPRGPLPVTVGSYCKNGLPSG